MSMRVAVLGCGPSGLVAAHAANAAGAEVTIFSRKRRSQIFGAQYLHDAIPGIDMWEPADIAYRLRGEVAEYRRKVYGMHGLEVEVSPDTLSERHKAWDLRRTYGFLWNMWESQIEDVPMRPDVVRQILRTHNRVFCSIPADVMCLDSSHYFHSTEIWAMGDAPMLGIQVPWTCEPNEVVCSGLPEDSWYRVSNIFGWSTIEWPNKEAAGDAGGALVRKPIGTTCDCWAGQLTRIGRYGEWRKGVLVHQVFDQVLAATAEAVA